MIASSMTRPSWREWRLPPGAWRSARRLASEVRVVTVGRREAVSDVAAGARVERVVEAETGMVEARW